MSEDAFGDRMKEYEGAEAGRRFMKLIPIMARIDGRKFSNFTRKMRRPYDQRMSDLMVATTRHLVKETNANCGYTQSDEITLTWYSASRDSQVFFDGRVQKMTSQLAAIATGYFNDYFDMYFVPGEYEREKTATFDARVWQVPNLTEGANTFLWREQDATKNAISMATRHYYSASEMHLKNGPDMQEMLFQKGVNFNNYPAFFKRGTFIQKKVVEREFTVDEMAALPERHEVFRNPNLKVERTEYRSLDMPPFGGVLNRPGVIYLGEEPVLIKDSMVGFKPGTMDDKTADLTMSEVRSQFSTDNPGKVQVFDDLHD